MVSGNDISYADIAIMPVIIRLEDINLSHFWDDFPGISNWIELLSHWMLLLRRFIMVRF